MYFQNFFLSDHFQTKKCFDGLHPSEYKSVYSQNKYKSKLPDEWNSPQTTRTSNRLWILWKKSYNKGLASAQSVPAVIVQCVCVLPLNSSHFILANTHCKQASVYINIDTHDQQVSFFIFTVCADRQDTRRAVIYKVMSEFWKCYFPYNGSFSL